MQFRTLTIGVALAIATLTTASSVTHASTKFESTTSQIQRQPNPPQIAQAELSDRQPFFAHPPRLIRAAASQTAGYTPSTYEFTLTVPQNAGQPLKAVTIAQVENLETIQFDTNRSRAFAGQRFAVGSEIPLASVGGPQPSNPGEVTVVFDQPVQPGSTVTVALETQSNPGWGGVYLFGITAFPGTENGLGQFLGYGRINFYGHSN
jgi:hypothetical protein